MYAMEKAMRKEVIPVRLETLSKLPDDYTAKLNSAVTVNI